MRVLERRIQVLERGEQDAYLAKEKQWQAIEERLGGFPSKRHCVPMSHPLGTTVIWEREWESLATMEDAYTRLVSDLESKQLFSVPSMILDDQAELYRLLT
jgi:hypothetical protein